MGVVSKLELNSNSFFPHFKRKVLFCSSYFSRENAGSK